MVGWFCGWARWAKAFKSAAPAAAAAAAATAPATAPPPPPPPSDVLLSSPPALVGGEGEGVRPGEAVGVGVGLLPLKDFCEMDDSAELCDFRIFGGGSLSASKSWIRGM